MRRALLALMMMVSPSTASAQEDATVIAGRAKTEAFLRRDIVSVWGAMAPIMRKSLGNRRALAAFRERLDTEFGSEAALLSEESAAQDGHRIYRRTARWTRVGTPVLMQWVFDGSGKVAGFFVTLQPVAAETRFLSYETKAALRLPFEGEWFVQWGGRSLEQNYHAIDRGQRFAYDFMVKKDGATHKGAAANLGHYYCWNQAILAPGDGTVAAARDGLPDQPIGSSDPANPAGNHVVIDFGQGEFGFLAHLRLGSVAVAAGERVAAGQRIGRCGNSGNTSEPHLHFHLQTTAELGSGEGLPAAFEYYRADGVEIARGEPGRGQTVATSPVE